jgi:hypothetical protein
MRGDLKGAPETVVRVAAAAEKSAKDAAEMMIKECNENCLEATRTREFYAKAVYVSREDNRNSKGEAWLVSDNYDRMGSLVYYVATGEWFYQPSYGEETLVEHGDDGAIGNAELMFHG